MSDDAAAMILAALRTLQAGQDELGTGLAGLRADLMARMDRLDLREPPRPQA